MRGHVQGPRQRNPWSGTGVTARQAVGGSWRSSGPDVTLEGVEYHLQRRRITDGPPAATPPPGNGTDYLDVPYGEKDLAKQAGARWDPKMRRSYDPHPDTIELQRWAARPEVPEQLPGEDRTFGDGLFVDLIPRSCWFTNVRSCVADREWERLRRPILRRAHHRCEACDTTADPRLAGRGLDVHERWHYDDHTGCSRCVGWSRSVRRATPPPTSGSPNSTATPTRRSRTCVRSLA